jgi:two-component system, chemotaxis family, chemotaxis protein CheY
MFPKETRILVVDDMMTMRKLVKKALTELGYTQLAEASNGSEAWQKITAQEGSGQPFQLIISDWNMPVMTGIELLRKCKQTPSASKTPFLLLTAESEKSQVIEALQLGVSGYMLKPFNAHQLAQKLAIVYGNLNKKAA